VWFILVVLNSLFINFTMVEFWILLGNFENPKESTISPLPLITLNFSTTMLSTIRRVATRRAFSSPSSSPPVPVLDTVMARGILSTTNFYLDHGITKTILLSIAKDKSTGEIDTKLLVPRWQKMMEAFFGCQVHVLAGLGYHPSEEGLRAYNENLAQLMATSNPKDQDDLRVMSRDVWRKTLAKSFEVEFEETSELSLMQARELMHKIGLKMNDEAFLSYVKSTLGEADANSDDSKSSPMDILKRKHTTMQETLIEHVYLGGEPSVLEEAGFEKSEIGYVSLQIAMAEHQHDPLIAQYLGGGMMKVMEAAGLNPS